VEEEKKNVNKGNKKEEKKVEAKPA